MSPDEVWPAPAALRPRHAERVLFTASCTDDWATDLIDLTRSRLAEIADALSSLRLEAEGLAAEARWDSDAARAFRRDAEALTSDVAALASDVEQLHDDLLVTRAHAAQRANWGCG